VDLLVQARDVGAQLLVLLLECCDLLLPSLGALGEPGQLLDPQLLGSQQLLQVAQIGRRRVLGRQD
jgi:hypothetical protein